MPLLSCLIMKWEIEILAKFERPEARAISDRYSSYIMRFKHFFFVIGIFLLSCSTKRTNAKDGLEFYKNGWVKSELIFQTGTTERIAYYSLLDSGSLDSIYHFQLFQDTLLPFYQLIFNDPTTNDDLTIQETFEESYKLNIELRNARGDWMYISFMNEESELIKTVHGPAKTIHNEPRTISITDSIRPSNKIIIGDWWIWAKPKSEIGQQLERQIFIDLDDWKNEL